MTRQKKEVLEMHAQTQEDVIEKLAGEQNNFPKVTRGDFEDDVDIPDDIIYTTLKHDEMMQKLEMEGFEVNIQISTPKDPLRPATGKKGRGGSKTMLWHEWIETPVTIYDVIKRINQIGRFDMIIRSPGSNNFKQWGHFPLEIDINSLRYASDYIRQRDQVKYSPTPFGSYSSPFGRSPQSISFGDNNDGSVIQAMQFMMTKFYEMQEKMIEKQNEKKESFLHSDTFHLWMMTQGKEKPLGFKEIMELQALQKNGGDEAIIKYISDQSNNTNQMLSGMLTQAMSNNASKDSNISAAMEIVKMVDKLGNKGGDITDKLLENAPAIAQALPSVIQGIKSLMSPAPAPIHQTQVQPQHPINPQVAVNDDKVNQLTSELKPFLKELAVAINNIDERLKNVESVKTIPQADEVPIFTQFEADLLKHILGLYFEGKENVIDTVDTLVKEAEHGVKLIQFILKLVYTGRENQLRVMLKGYVGEDTEYLQKIDALIDEYKSLPADDESEEDNQDDGAEEIVSESEESEAT